MNIMAIEIYRRVRLVTDRFASTDDVSRGAIGYVIEAYPEGNFEVEFSGEGGITYAQIVAKTDELEDAENDG